MHISKLVKNHALLILLMLISLVSHWYIFLETKPLNAGDWIYLPRTVLPGLLYETVWSSHNGFGTVIIFGSNQIFYWLTSLLAQGIPGFTWDIFTRLFFLVPMVFFAPLFAYLFFKKIFKESRWAFAAACLYAFNTFFLKLQLDWLTYGNIWWILPAMLLAIENYWDRGRRRYLVYTGGLTFLGMVYETRIMMLGVLMAGLYIICRFAFSDRVALEYKKSFILGMAMFAGLVAQAFWLLPAKMGLAGDILGNASSSLFTAYYDLIDSLALHSYQWSHNLMYEAFFKQAVDLRLLIAPSMAIIGLAGLRYYVRKKQDLSIVVFSFLLTFIGVFFSKQTFPPLGDLYNWAFYHVPLFNVYRESSKFIIIAALGMSFFFALGLKSTYEFLRRRNIKAPMLAIGTVLFISTIFSLQHFVDQKIGGMTQGSEVNADYLAIEKKLAEDPTYYRILWNPGRPRFGFTSQTHPALTIGDFLGPLEDRVEFKLYDKTMPVNEQLGYLLKQPYSHDILNDASVKYIFVAADDVRERQISSKSSVTVPASFPYNNSHQTILNDLDAIGYLRRVDFGTKDIVVYENKAYKPYITATDTIYSLQTSVNIGLKTQFIKNWADSALSSTTNSPSSNIAALTDTLDNLRVDELTEHGIQRSLPVSGNTKLVVNKNGGSLSYTLSDKRLTIYRRSVGDVGVAKDGATITRSGTPVSVASASLSAPGDYYLQLGSKLVSLADSRNASSELQGDIGKLALLRANEAESSNDQELNKWEINNAICGVGNSGSKKLTKLKDDPSHKNATEVITYDGAACISSQPMNIGPGGQLVLSLDYLLLGSQAAITVTYDDPRKSTNEFELNGGFGWNSRPFLLSIPKGAHSLTITLRTYAAQEGEERTTKASFDNVSLKAVRDIQEFNILPLPNYAGVPIDPLGSVAKINYVDPSLSIKNLINDPALKKGLWESTVGDCNYYDSNPKLGMRLAEGSKPGYNAIQLEASRHIACTSSPEVAVEPGREYLLSLDYQGVNAAEYGYEITYNDASHTTVRRRLPIKKTTWQQRTEVITVPIGAHSIRLSLFGYSQENGITNSINRYSNFHLSKLPDIRSQYMLVSIPATPTKMPQNITYHTKSPAEKAIHVSGATTAFYISMSEAYHPNWRLELNNGKVHGLNSWLPWAKPDAVPDSDHFKLNDFMNGWYVDVDKLCRQQHLCKQNADGSYDLEMVAEFTPQRWFYVGLIISATTLAGCLGYLGWTWHRRRGATLKGGIESKIARKKKLMN